MCLPGGGCLSYALCQHLRDPGSPAACRVPALPSQPSTSSLLILPNILKSEFAAQSEFLEGHLGFAYFHPGNTSNSWQKAAEVTVTLHTLRNPLTS